MTAAAILPYFLAADPPPVAHFAGNDSSEESGRDHAWAERIKAGDHDALTALFTVYFPRLVTFARRYVASRDVAEDVVQDVLIKLWIDHVTWRIPDSVAAYLYRSVRNRAIEVRRHDLVIAKHEETVLTLSVPAIEHPGTEQLEARDLRLAAERAITKLAPRCREIFLLNRVHGLTYREISATLDISQSTVETQMARAIRALHLALADFRR